MTLPEVLIAVTLMALITTVLSASIIVTLRSRSTTESKLNAAGSEQSIGLWMPADLSSALKILGGSATEQSAMIVCPGAGSECPGYVVSGGSYAMLIQWRSLIDDEVSAGVNSRQYLYTNVAYYFMPAAGVIPGASGVYELVRIECTNTVTVTGTSADVVSRWAVPGEAGNPGGGGWSCAGNVAARLDLTPSELSGWVPGAPVPPEVVRVTSALDPTATQDLVEESANLEDTTARRVMVTVNSGGAEGATTISITAGGSYRDELPAISMQNAPDFVAARSRCGGPLTLVIDKSNSITSPTNYSTSLRDSVRGFVETLIGTPVRLQFVMFGSKAAVVSPSSTWSYYYDLSDTAPGGAVEQLLGTPNASGQYPANGGLLRSTTGGVFHSNEFSGQYTNWEDGVLRAIRTSTGSIPQVMPRSIVFFTDGIPTRDRSYEPASTYRSDSAGDLVPGDDPAWNAHQPTGIDFYQDAFNRANYWADLVRGPVNMVGVYVGPTDPTTATSTWWARPQGYTLTYQERTHFEYQRRRYDGWTYYQSQYERATNPTYQGRYQIRTSNNSNAWIWVDYATYQSSPATRTPGNYSARRDQGWTDITSSSTATGNRTPANWFAFYNQANEGQNDGVRTRVASNYNWNTASNRQVITQAQYDADNYTTDSLDGFRIVENNLGSTQNAANQYDAGNQTGPAGDSSDGWRKTLNSGSQSGWVWQTTSETDYNTHNTGQNQDDGYRKVPVGFPAPSDASNPWKASDAAAYAANRYTPSGSGLNPSGEAAGGYRQFNDTTSANPATYFAPQPVNPSNPTIPNIDILGRLVAGSDNYILGQPDGSGNYPTNADVYAGTWAQIGGALVKIALGECGGTLTLATQNGTSYVSSPFQYQESINQTTRTTNVQDTAVTFDFDFPDGLAKTVDVVPVNLTSLTGFSPASAHPWSCRAGARVLNEGEHFWVSESPTTPGWPKLTVRVGANEAVSCSQQVVQH